VRTRSILVSRLILLSALVASPAGALAADIAWNSPVDGVWSDPANWSPPIVPGPSDDVSIALLGAYTVTLDVHASVHSLTLGASGPATDDKQTLYTPGATLVIGAGFRLTPDGVLDFESSAISVADTLENLGTLDLFSTDLSAGMLDNRFIAMKDPSSTIAGPIDNRGKLVLQGSTNLAQSLVNRPGAIMRVEGTPLVPAIFNIPDSYTNYGELDLACALGFGNVTINATGSGSGHVSLVNAPGALMHSYPDGARVIGAQLENHGTLDVQQPLTINRPGAAHVNDGTITLTGGNLTAAGSGASLLNRGVIAVGAGRTFSQGTGTSFTNDTTGVLRGGGTFNLAAAACVQRGHIAPGDSVGRLGFIGNLEINPGGSVDIEIGGAAPGTGYDVLSVGAFLIPLGTLDISLVPGFEPAPGQRFEVIQWGDHAGVFARIDGLTLPGGLALVPEYSASGLSLTCVAQTWTHLIPTGAAPSAREGHAAVYDSASDRMIVFGGRSDAGPLSDVWVLDHADGRGGRPQWTPLAPAGAAPAPRAHMSAVYDPATNRMTVFGGDDANPTSPARFGDVWVLTNANGLGGAPSWIRVAPPHPGPAARSGHSAIYDRGSNRMTVFGGATGAGACGTPANDAWVLAGANAVRPPAWIELSPSGAPPPPRAFHGASFDAATRRMSVVGGAAACGSPDTSLWVLSDADGRGDPAWTPLAPAGAPRGAWGPGPAVYDPTGNRLTVFGGTLGGAPTDTTLTLTFANGLGGAPSWVDRAPSGAPPEARTGHSAVQADRRMIVFGGSGASGLLADVWVLDEAEARVEDAPVENPAGAAREQVDFDRAPYPNPARSTVSLSISVPHGGPAVVVITDVAGRVVATLRRGFLAAGDHEFAWHGVTDRGTRAPAGLYFVTARCAKSSATRKLLLVE